tara:strand:+ start:896 stop:1159 length:264 start_codon:yes stop_codon:yes gene_type:complete
MNRQFIKENKKLMREFIGSFVKAMASKKAVKGFDAFIKNDPVLKKHNMDVARIGKQIKQRIEKRKAEDPKFKKFFADLQKQLDSEKN